MSKVSEKIYQEHDKYCKSRVRGSCVNKDCMECGINFTLNYMEKELKKLLTVKNK